MAKFRVHIGSFSNISSDPNFFIGTGFSGYPIESIEDFKEAMYKYASFEKDGQKYWRNEVKISFQHEETFSAFKAEGDKQCAEQGFVDLFKVALAVKKDDLYHKRLYFRPNGFKDKDGNIFKVLIEINDVFTPYYGKLSEALEKIGITFNK